MSLADAVITDHAAKQMRRRGLQETHIRRVLKEPEQVLAVREGRILAQAIIGAYLMRVFVDVDRSPAEVVTAYRTSKIDKYRDQP